MAYFFQSALANTTARTLRAVCILSLACTAGMALGASVPIPVEMNAAPSTKPPAQTPKASQPITPPKTPIKAAKPLWTDLTPLQQQALAPLSSDWDKLDSLRKKKWLAFAKKFPAMKPEEQQRVQERMRDWAKLSPEQRRAARATYARAKKLNPDQKSAQWEQYQSLPEDQKKKLAAEADNKKHVANLPRTAIKKNKPPIPAKTALKPTLEQPAAPQIPPSTTSTQLLNTPPTK